MARCVGYGETRRSGRHRGPALDHAAVAAVLGPVLGSAVQAAMRGDLAAAFDTAMTGLCGPGSPAAINAALGSAGLLLARANCGYFFTGENRP